MAKREERTFSEGLEIGREMIRSRYKEEEIRKCGVKTYERDSREHRFRSKVTVIPVEIEVSSELDQFVKFEILDGFDLTYPKWIQKCYIERMRQILSDPAEFGKVVLERKKSDHCIQNADDVGDY
jgi:hypothetical protein